MNGVAQLKNEPGGSIISFNLNKSLSSQLQLNAKWESRILLLRQGASSEQGLQYQRSDLELIATVPAGLRAKAGGGLLLRMQQGRLQYRLVQQYALVRTHGPLKVGHRFRADQQFAAGRPPRFRLRYRISAQLPFSGEKVDIKEFYFKAANEYLPTLRAANFDVEIRGLLVLGFVPATGHKLEAGLDARLSGTLLASQSLQNWLALSWYIPL